MRARRLLLDANKHSHSLGWFNAKALRLFSTKVRSEHTFRLRAIRKSSLPTTHFSTMAESQSELVYADVSLCGLDLLLMNSLADAYAH